MTQRKLIAANWKMNKGVVESEKFAEEIKSFYDKTKNLNCDIVICPPYTTIHLVYKKTNGTDIKLGAQNVYHESNGAFTGEISCQILKSVGCKYVIIGHSERRHYFNETNEVVNKKVIKVLDEGLKPILCIGETLAEHQDKLTEAVIEEQTAKCLNQVPLDMMDKVVIAYEPVWAIGTGKTATPHQAETVHNVIRRKLKKMYNDEIAQNIRILYGGSVTPENARELFASDSISGALIGGASLDEKKFIEIINCTF